MQALFVCLDKIRDTSVCRFQVGSHLCLAKSSVHAAIFAPLCTEVAVENILFYFNPLNKRSSESLCTQAFQTTAFLDGT